MTLRQRVGTLLLGKAPEPKVIQPVKEKLTTSGLGAGFLELFRPSLQNEKTASEQLIRSFYGWVYANVSAIAEEVSKIELELYQVRFEAGQVVYDRILEHPVLDLLDKFNTVNTASEAFYVTSADLDLVGDAFYLKDKPVQPTELYLLDPTKVTVEPRKDGFGVEKYIYKRVVDGKQEEITYRPDQILPIKTPNPENPLRGKSTVAAAAISIDTANLAQEFLKKFFQNGAIVNFALTTDQRISPDDIRRIQQQLKREYGGVMNAFKALILGGGYKVEQIQHTNKEMQILDLETAMRDKIMAMFKNTKTSLGIVEDVNRANAEASLASWKQSVIKPRMMRIADALNEYLVPDYGDNLILGFKDPVPEDREGKITEATALVNKVITVNEARTNLGYEPIPDPNFDTLISETERMEQEKEQFEAQRQDNKDKDKQKPKALEMVSLERHLRRQGVFKRYESYQALYKSAHDLAARLVQMKRKKPPKKPYRAVKRTYESYSDEQAMAYWRKQVGQAELVEQQFSKRLDSYLEGIENKAVAVLHENATKAGNPKIRIVKATFIDDQAEVQTALDLFTPLLNEIAELSGVDAYEFLRLSAIYVPSRKMEEQIRNAVKEMANSVIGTDDQKLQMILSEGLDKGQSIAEIERRIRAEFSEFRRNQSLKIARTETLRASNAGALDAYRESGVVSRAQWLTAPDCIDDCLAYNGKMVALGRSFFDADYGSGTQPPLHPNCRCTLIPVLDDEKSVGDKLDQALKELSEVSNYATELEAVVGINE